MKRASKICITTFCLISLCSCNPKYLEIAPLPTYPISIDDELKYIENTDQTDRKKGFVHIVFHDKNGKRIIQRDSIRANRVYEIYMIDSLTIYRNKFTAGLILMHSTDTTHNRAAYNIFEDIELHGSKEWQRQTGEHWKNQVYK